MATYKSSTVFDPNHPPLVLAVNPLQSFFEAIHNKQLMFRGISGRLIVTNGERVHFHPDKKGFKSQAYKDDVAELGDPWHSWCLDEDTEALLEVSKILQEPFYLEIDLRVSRLPGESDRSHFKRSLQHERLAHLEIWPPGDLIDVTPFADWVDELLVLMGVD